MSRVLFVSNGHGEASIAERIAKEMRSADTTAALAHFPLVGTGPGGDAFADVGPRRTMPSGGLVAMGNVRAFARDMRAGFPALFAAQLAFLRAQHGHYDIAVAVGDVYALALTLVARLKTVFVGTAKSASVASYGPFERVMLRRAAAVFVRDERTAAELRTRGVSADAPGNVIADLHRDGEPALPGDWLGLLPGSREPAYGDALWLARVVRRLADFESPRPALLSIAPGLDAARFAGVLRADGWSVEPAESPAAFVATCGPARIVGWGGELGALLRSSTIVVGQAGTANEAAAGLGIPVVAPEGKSGLGSDWYRMRQRRLLGDALATVPADPAAAAQAIGQLLHDPQRLALMSRVGIERMGGAGGARRIAEQTLALLHRTRAAS